MEVGILSMRYAKAMIEYAQEKGVEDKLYQEFLTLSYCFCAQPGLREALDNPVISTKEKLALVCTAADGNGKSTREFVHFITLVFTVYQPDVSGSLPETKAYRGRQTDYGCSCGQGDGRPYPLRSSAYPACANGTGDCGRSVYRGRIHLRY